MPQHCISAHLAGAWSQPPAPEDWVDESTPRLSPYWRSSRMCAKTLHHVNDLYNYMHGNNTASFVSSNWFPLKSWAKRIPTCKAPMSSAWEASKFLRSGLGACRSKAPIFLEIPGVGVNQWISKITDYFTLYRVSLHFHRVWSNGLEDHLQSMDSEITSRCVCCRCSWSQPSLECFLLRRLKSNKSTTSETWDRVNV